MRENFEQLKRAISDAEAIVVGAGAGLSASAGYEYGSARFSTSFGDFEKKYGFRDMYAGGFYPFPTREEFWGFWSRFILLNRYTPPPKDTYEKLLRLLSGRDYFVVTTNVDHCFQRAGFDKKRLFYTQGDYGLFQCGLPCSEAVYDNEEAVREMVKTQKDGKIPSRLVPRCPKCGRELVPNLRSDGTFVETEGWREACRRYLAFFARHKKSRVLFLELGVGYNTPAIVKFPFWKMTAENENATYACINPEAECPEEIADRAILLRGDIHEALSLLQ